jgi:hypothetical protein
MDDLLLDFIEQAEAVVHCWERMGPGHEHFVTQFDACIVELCGHWGNFFDHDDIDKPADLLEATEGLVRAWHDASDWAEHADENFEEDLGEAIFLLGLQAETLRTAAQ